MAGNLFALNRFALQDDEALLITLDPLGAKYWTIATCEPWSTSVEYDRHCSSLNNVQAQANADGTVTVALSPTDPGVHNWLDTEGFRDGAMAARWESLAQEAQTRAAGHRTPAANRGRPRTPRRTSSASAGCCRSVRCGT